ncbi:hypothetical protein C8J57DRAFT_1714232 [Mycena rebaudengoi]|nr:hypothetical protein C8J57DRAFT_1714232 [Mycena rebaudengoi]
MQYVPVETMLASILQLPYNQRVVSHNGVGQHDAGSPAGCGLASMNFARFVMEKVLTGVVGWNLIRQLIRRESAIEILSICALWTRETHLEVLELVDLPLFSKSMKLELERLRQGRASLDYFNDTIRELQQLAQLSMVSAAVITRPPVIIACTSIVTDDGPVFFVFDSHPLTGATFTFSTTEDTAARDLDQCLHGDERMMNASLSNAQDYGVVLSHFFTPNTSFDPNPEALTMTIAESSISILLLRSINESLTTRLNSVGSHTEPLLPLTEFGTSPQNSPREAADYTLDLGGSRTWNRPPSSDFSAVPDNIPAGHASQDWFNTGYTTSELGSYPSGTDHILPNIIPHDTAGTQQRRQGFETTGPVSRGTHPSTRSHAQMLPKSDRPASSDRPSVLRDYMIAQDLYDHYGAGRTTPDFFPFRARYNPLISPYSSAGLSRITEKTQHRNDGSGRARVSPHSSPALSDRSLMDTATCSDYLIAELMQMDVDQF